MITHYSKKWLKNNNIPFPSREEDINFMLNHKVSLVKVFLDTKYGKNFDAPSIRSFSRPFVHLINKNFDYVLSTWRTIQLAKVCKIPVYAKDKKYDVEFEALKISTKYPHRGEERIKQSLANYNPRFFEYLRKAFEPALISRNQAKTLLRIHPYTIEVIFDHMDFHPSKGVNGAPPPRPKLSTDLIPDLVKDINPIQKLW